MASVCIDDNNLWFVSIQIDQFTSIHCSFLLLHIWRTKVTQKPNLSSIDFKMLLQSWTLCTCLFHFDSYFLFSSASRDYIKKEKPSLKMFEGVVVLSFLFILRLPFWLLPKTPVGLKIMTKNIGHHSRQYNRAIIELKSMNYYCMLITTFLKVDWISEVQTWDICVGCALRVNIIMWIRVGTM